MTNNTLFCFIVHYLNDYGYETCQFVYSTSSEEVESDFREQYGDYEIVRITEN